MSKRRRSSRLRAEALEQRHLLAAQIVGHVWFDGDQSGRLDGFDVVVADTEVRLIDSAGSIVAEMLSDEDGDFEFEDLPPGEYFVEVVPPDGTEFTAPGVSGEWSESDVDPLTGRTAMVTLADEAVEEIMVGLVAPYGTAKITGRVWHDANVNGIQDQDEPGIAFAEVQVENIHLEKIFEVYTDENGDYEIDHTVLPPGNYVLDFKRPPRNGGLRWEISPQSVAEVDGALDSDASSVNGKTDLFYLEPADQSSTPPNVVLDAGFHRSTFIKGNVFHDLSAKGRDSYNVAGLEVRLLDASAQVIATTYTSKFGNYEFLGLAGGEYRIEAVLPEGVLTMTDGMDPVSGRSAPLIVSASEGAYFDVSLATELGTDSIAGRLWHDINANGIQDPDEPGIANQEFSLQNHRFSHLMEVETDENGNYEIVGSLLLPGEYVLSLGDFITSIPTLGNYATTWKVGPFRTNVADLANDNDFRSLSTRSKLISLDLTPAGEERGERRIDGGLYRFGFINGLVFDDENQDGIRNSGERTVGRVTAQLWDADNQLVKTTRADLTGNFWFAEVVPGDYTVQVVSPDGTSFSPQWEGNGTLVSQVDPANGRVQVFVPSAETVQVAAGVFGNSEATEITGTVWDDANGDGIRDVGETGLGGVTVELFDSQSLKLLSVLSNQDGSFHFTVSATDSYTVRFLPPVGTTLSPMNRGNDDTVDSDVNRFSQRTSYFPVIGGQSASHVDAGIYGGPISNDARSNIRVSEVGFVGHGYSEFVEIKNVGDEPVSIDGVRFSKGVRFDFSTSPTKSLFPGEHAVVVGETHTLAQRVELNEINLAGEYDGDLDREEKLTLVDNTDNTILSFRYDDDWFVILDSEFLPWTLTVVDDQADTSAWELKSNWRPSSYLQGSPGTDDPGVTPDPGTVVINEVVAKSADDFNDLIEIYNTSDQDLDISNWYLGDSDDDIEPLVYLTRYRFPEGTVIPAHDYLVLTREQDFGNPDNPNAGFPFGLSSFGEGVHLIAADRLGNMLGYSDSAAFAGSDVGDVFGRYVTGSQEAIFTQLSAATFGGPNAAPLIGDVLIDEIMYAPAGDNAEYFGIVNASDTTADLTDGFSAWTVEGAVSYVFRGSAELAPGGRALIVSTLPEVFRQQYDVPADVAVFGPFDGKLSNAGDEIRLYRYQSDAPRRFLVDQVSYRDDTPWPREADVGGVALVRRSTEVVGSDPANWTHSALPGDANLDGVVDGQDFNIWNEHRFANDATWLEGDFDSNRVVDARDFNVWNANRFRSAAGSWDDGGGGRIPRAPLAAREVDAAVVATVLGDSSDFMRLPLWGQERISAAALAAVTADQPWDEHWPFPHELHGHRRMTESWHTHSAVYQETVEDGEAGDDRELPAQVADRILFIW